MKNLHVSLLFTSTLASGTIIWGTRLFSTQPVLHHSTTSPGTTFTTKPSPSNASVSWSNVTSAKVTPTVTVTLPAVTTSITQQKPSSPASPTSVARPTKTSFTLDDDGRDAKCFVWPVAGALDFQVAGIRWDKNKLGDKGGGLLDNLRAGGSSVLYWGWDPLSKHPIWDWWAHGRIIGSGKNPEFVEAAIVKAGGPPTECEIHPPDKG